MIHDLVIIDPDDDSVLGLALTSVPTGATGRVVEGYAARHSAAVTGECSWCGQKRTMPNRAERRAAVRRGDPVNAVVEHESWCPAVDPKVLAAVGDTRDHGRGRS